MPLIETKIDKNHVQLKYTCQIYLHFVIDNEIFLVDVDVVSL